MRFAIYEPLGYISLSVSRKWWLFSVAFNMTPFLNRWSPLITFQLIQTSKVHAYTYSLPVMPSYERYNANKCLCDILIKPRLIGKPNMQCCIMSLQCLPEYSEWILMILSITHKLISASIENCQIGFRFVVLHNCFLSKFKCLSCVDGSRCSCQKR